MKLKYFFYNFILFLNKWNFFNKSLEKLSHLHLHSRGYVLDWKYVTKKSSNNLFKGENIFLSKLKSLNIKNYLDIGANIGDYSLEILKNKETKVIAFEPLIKCCDKLKKIKDDYPDRFEFYNLALSNIQKEDYIYFGEDVSSLASLEKSINRIDYVGLSNQNKVITKLETLDNIYKNSKIKNIDFIKLDVEGHEMKVLEGGKNLIDKENVKIIQLEFNWHHMMTKNTLLEFSEFLNKYEVFQLNLINGSLLKRDPKDPLSNIYLLSNFIFIEKNFFNKNKNFF